MKSRVTGRVRIKVERLAHAEGLPLPAYQTAGAAGLDLVAAVPADRPLVIAPGAWAQVPTGLRMELPAGTEAQVRPRSGLAFRHGLTVLNAPGTIDSDYRGEVAVLLVNHGREPFLVRRGERIAQLVVQPVMVATLIEVEALAETQRGAGGFGSTGVGQSGAASTVRREKKQADPPVAPRGKSRSGRRR